jgi:hypothetical protein
MPRRDAPDSPTRIETDDARAGSNEGVVRWVLAISLAGAIIALTVIWVTGAFQQSAVENEGTTEGRERVRQEEASSAAQGDGVGADLAEDGGMVAPSVDEAQPGPVTPTAAPDG